MYMPRICYGYVKKASLNKYKKIYISQCICQGYVMAIGYVQEASLNIYNTIVF